jgi:hypothetical protein
LYLSKFCLESGLDGSIEAFFEEISKSLANLDIHIESIDLTEAENIDEFLFQRLNEKELALLSLGVAVGMVQSVLLSLSSEDGPTPPLTQGKMIGTIDLALHRIGMVLAELGISESAGALVEQIHPLLGDFDKLKASSTFLLSEIQVFGDQIRMQFES